MKRNLKKKKTFVLFMAAVMLLVILPASALAAGDHPELVSASITSTGELELAFDMAMADPSADAASFAVRRNDGSMRTGDTAALKPGDDTTIVLTPNFPLRGGEIFTARYTPGNVTASDGKTLEAFSNFPVINGLPHPTLADVTLPMGFVNNAYNHTFAVSGGTPSYMFNVSAGTLPAGMSLSQITGVLSGVPTAAGTYWFRVQVSDTAYAVDTREYTVTISTLTVPTAPKAFVAAPGDGQVKLAWAIPDSDGGSPITKYEVSKDNGAHWVDAAADATSYTFTGLTNGQEYTFRVRAVNIVGESAYALVNAAPATGNVCAIGTEQYASFAAALAAVNSGETIRMLQSVTHTSPVVIDGKNVAFDLNNGDLTIEVASGTALTVRNGGSVTLSGSGWLDVKGAWIGVLANNGTVTVRNAEAAAGTGAWAENGGIITVLGGAEGVSDGAYATGSGSTITVTGVATATSDGGAAAVAHSSGYVQVGHAVATGINSYGARADGVGSAVEIIGNVQGVRGGIGAENSAEITVGGNVTANGSGSVGAEADTGGKITVDGDITAENYVRIGSAAKAADENDEGTNKSGYLQYSDSVSDSYVWVKQFDSGSTPAVVTNAVSNVAASGASLSGSVAYTLSGSITERGFVYATHATPTTGYDSKLQTGSGTGSFSAAMSGLSPNTTYYVRAYAILSGEVVYYGSEIHFTTLSGGTNPGANPGFGTGSGQAINPETTAGVPNTGDNGTPWLIWLLFGASAASAGTAMAARKKRIANIPWTESPRE
ncbi:MAG TPA: fibronectin type III domain-containing protein [Clostridia bacterium]|nr:fibronectin type III domain-containing protein [Clostridia bacterium]